MLIKIGASLSVMAQYIRRRGNSFQFYMRIPQHLQKHYGKDRIPQNLNTVDERKAVIVLLRG